MTEFIFDGMDPTEIIWYHWKFSRNFMQIIKRKL